MISAYIANLFSAYRLHIVLAVSVILNLWLISRPKPHPVQVTKTEYVDRIVEKEVVKVVNNDIVKYKDRVITRTITKPGGTQIVEQIKEVAGEHDKSSAVAREQVVDKEVRKSESVAVYPKAARYLLSVGITPRGSFSSGSAGYRIVDSIPVYLGAGVSKFESNYGLTLNVGVVF
jgi:hypothetical protein